MDLSLTEQEDGEPDISQLTPIQEFYKDANILITGGTGFLGKLLIEKLLRSCNELSKIYLIVRSKNGKDMPSRLEDIFQDGVFDTLKRQYPKFKRKIVGIAGDCTLPSLGLSTENRKLLQDNVNIIFHAAATLRCEEKFKIAMATNVQATKDILQLAKDTPNLKSFVYVSNVYSNFTLDKIEEKVGKPVAPYGAFLELSKFPDKLLEKMTPILLDRYPNTHVFTKQLSEVVLNELGEGLPIGIFRSATIMSTYREPINGWINNEHGPAGVIAGIFLGLIRVFHCDKNLAADIVPADMVVNALISSCWEVGVEFQENVQSQVKVYNYESTTENPLRWESVVEKIYENGKECPSVQAVWHPFVIQTKCFYYMKLMMFLLHTIPAYFVDVVSFCMGKDQSMVKLYDRFHKVSEDLGYFVTNRFRFRSINIATMRSRMSVRDRDVFFCDLNAISWDDYFTNYFKGIRVYLLRDPLDSLGKGLSKARKLYWYHQILKTVLATLLMSVLWMSILCMFLK